MQILKTNRNQGARESEYRTATIDGPHRDGSWTAELSKDGVPYAQITIGSISSLIAQSSAGRV